MSNFTRLSAIFSLFLLLGILPGRLAPADSAPPAIVAIYTDHGWMGRNGHVLTIYSGGVSFLAESALGAWQSEYHDYQSVPKGYTPMPTDEGFVDLGPDQTFSISYKVLPPEKDMSMGLASAAVDAQLAATPVISSLYPQHPCVWAFTG